MIELDLYRQQTWHNIRESIVEAGDVTLTSPGLKEQLLELHETMNEPDFWNDLKRSTEVSRKVRITENKVEHYEKLCQRADDVDTTMELCRGNAGYRPAGRGGRGNQKAAKRSGRASTGNACCAATTTATTATFRCTRVRAERKRRIGR